MSEDATLTPTVPYVDILREYHRVESLSTAERVAWKETLIEEPETLAAIFLKSLEQLEAGFGADQVAVPFNGKDTKNGPKPPPVPKKLTARTRKTHIKTGPKTDLEKAHEIVYAVFEAGGITVSGAPLLAADYAGYKVAPLRTKAEGAFAGDDVPELDPSEVSLDLLLQSRDEEALPIIGELKYGEDVDPLVALLEALTYVALLSTPTQYKRVRKHFTKTDEEGTTTARFAETDTPRFDIYLIIAGHQRNAASKRSALWDALPAVIDALLDQPEIVKHVRRIEGVKVPLGGDARVQLAGDAVLAKPVRWEED
jgi:plasmid stabilization system protein ParE